MAAAYAAFMPRLLGLFDALEQGGVLDAVLVADRLGRLVERGLVGGNEGHALGLEVGFGGHGLLVPELSLLELRLAREFLEQRLVVGREAVPRPLREDEDLRNDQV